MSGLSGRRRPVAAWVLVSLLSATMGVGAQGEPTAAQRLATQAGSGDKAQVDKRLETVTTLLEKSSAAKKVEASGDARALKKRDEAKALHRQAAEAGGAGDYPLANRLLSQASAVMFEAVKLASPDVAVQKIKDDFKNRLESVKALLSAQKRISDEKANVKDAAQISQEIEKTMRAAEDLAGANKYEEAAATLNRAYLQAKAAISSMRSGDTLVRDLKFKNKEEEYHYELDRNETHQLLIKVLVEEKRSGDAMIQGFMTKSKQLRSEAEASASRGDHAAAVKLLEDSTAELVKAIRNAGIFIPG